MVLSREAAARKAESFTRFAVGYCQVFTREAFDAPSVGDVDGDGDADAVDGWKSEPEWARVPGDRNPPRGVPCAFSGGRKGFGHRAPSVGGGKVRSTDMNKYGRYEAGSVATVTIAQVEAAMDVDYTGWTKTISGKTIPGTPTNVSPKSESTSRGTKVDQARAHLRKARGSGKRGELIKKAKRALRKINPL